MQTDENHVLIIGGRQDSYTSEETWQYNIDDWSLSKGPPLNVAREAHCCGKIVINDRLFATGGWEEDTIELLDLSSESSWVMGPSLPHQLVGATMIMCPCGEGIIVRLLPYFFVVSND